MSKKITAVEIFNVLEVFRREELKLVKQSAGLVALTVGVASVSTTVLPETVALVPTVLVGAPAMAVSFKKALKADKVSNHADKIFMENRDEIIDFKLGSMKEVEEFTMKHPVLSKKYPNLLK